jgi:hypothetical protein
MTLGIKKRYYCTNIKGGCQYALKHHIYTERQYKANKKCIGNISDGCGEFISPDHIDYRKKLYSSLIFLFVLLFCLSIYLKNIFFPEPIKGVSFTSNSTHIDESIGQVEINIKRDGDLNEALSISFVSNDGTAKAGYDYQALKGNITFEPRQGLAKIPVTILPDNDISESDEVFSIILTDVEAQPQHEIFIKEAPPSKEALEKIDIIVRDVRDLADKAKSIADYARKLEITKNLISCKGSSLNNSQLKTYTDKYQIMSSNLNQLRDRYVELLHELSYLDKTTVIMTIDKRITYLKQQNLIQLHDATQVMKEHFIYYLQNEVLDMDKLITLLNDTIPRTLPEACGDKINF